MRIRLFTLSMGYELFRISQGLLFHPYRTMRELVRKNMLIWMAAFPSLFWLFGVAMWKLLAIIFVSLLPYPTFWVFLALWFTIFCSLHQVLLVYFFVRFFRVEWQLKHPSGFFVSKT